ncbi:hypothetical protein NIES4102_31810 [Chondrocystis sp. NIES-4102]|nr:hypothetical protein NIES4102_31810 [Chondrocystis sp. NIES-4102]
MKLYQHFCLVISLIFLVSCTSLESSSKLMSNIDQVNLSQKEVILNKDFQIAMGQTIYVPIYSYIYHEDRQKILNLAATLSIRNTDLNQSIIITTVDYYDSNGKLIKQYLNNPIQIQSLASTDFFIHRNDNSGGVGANFIVEWVAAKKVSDPIIEAVMIATESQQGISFVSPGKVIESKENNKS